MSKYVIKSYSIVPVTHKAGDDCTWQITISQQITDILLTVWSYNYLCVIPGFHEAETYNQRLSTQEGPIYPGLITITDHAIVGLPFDMTRALDMESYTGPPIHEWSVLRPPRWHTASWDHFYLSLSSKTGAPSFFHTVRGIGFPVTSHWSTTVWLSFTSISSGWVLNCGGSTKGKIIEMFHRLSAHPRSSSERWATRDHYIMSQKNYSADTTSHPKVFPSKSNSWSNYRESCSQLNRGTTLFKRNMASTADITKTYFTVECYRFLKR